MGSATTRASLRTPPVSRMVSGVIDPADDEDDIPPAPSRLRPTIPYLIGATMSLLLVYAWLTPHQVPLRLLSAAGAAAAVALMLLHQSATMSGLYLSNAALSLANHRLATNNDLLHRLATTDPLTGLPNRALLHERLEHALRRGPHRQPRAALLLLDLNHFKEVNDTLGHQAGDLLLKELGKRLLDALGTLGSMARLGGDEFALLLPDTNVDAAEGVARQCLQALDAPFILEGHTLHVGGSIGVALAPDHGTDASTLLRCADVAMYLAKRRQAGYAFYASSEDQHSRSRLTLAGELQRAIQEGDLCLYYQPTMHLATGRVRGVEALVRWSHPQHGLLSPDQFIPLAEQTGLIVPLTSWVLESALRQCRAWQDAGLSLTVAVNLSMRNLQDPQLPDIVAGLLRDAGIAPALLTLEITESMLMADPISAQEVLIRLAALGVRLAIDDFGTGHSSLGYLKLLPVAELKIDRTFVLELDAQRNTGVLKDRMIVRSVTALAHALGLEVVAEGVESRRSYELLAAFRCDVAQGYYLSPPLAAAAVERWVREAPATFALHSA